MDDFPGLLASNYGFRAAGKAAPMAASKGGTLNYGIGSGGNNEGSRSSSLNRGKSSWNSTPPVANSFLDDENLFRSSSGHNNNNDFDAFSDVYGGPPKHSNNQSGDNNNSNTRKSSTSLDYDAMFQGINDNSSGVKTSSLPVYDKPVYDDDIFDGVPGMKSTASVNYDDVFATSSSPPKQKDRKNTSSYDDVFSSFTSPPRRKETSMKNTSSANPDDIFTSTSSPPKQKDQFDDLLGNLGRRNPQESKSSTRKGSEVRRDTSNFDDLIPGFGDRSPSKNRGTPETSHPRQSTVPSNKATSMSDEPFVIIEPGSVPAYESSEIFSDPLEQFNKLHNPDSSYINSSSGSGVFNSMNSLDDFANSVPSFSSSTKGKMEDTHSLRTGAKTTSTRSAAVEEPAEEPFFRAAKSSSPKVEAPPMSEVNADSAGDIWITVSEVPLFTQPTSAPPPSRPPPPRPVQVSKADDASRHARNVREKTNEYSSSHYSSPRYQSPPAVPSSGSNMGMSSVDELEDFARAKEHNDDRPDVLSSEEEVDTNSAAAAMKEAMDRAEAKFKQAREVRERENVRTGRNRDQEKDEKASRDAQERELRERQERLDREREQREKEEKRLDRERRDKEREQTRQVVERAQREARERAAVEARQKAQKVAVEKATAEARERAERAAVQRAQNEARERAAAGAKERAEKAAREAKERAAAERAAAEARERAAEARARPSTTREHQQRNENDLENFFNRPNSAPRPNRATTSESMFDSQPQNRPAPAPGRTSPGNPSTIRKAHSTTNIVDDLTSIFGGSPSSGDFPDIDGETEERRRARMERHQRTQERAAKALAEKNERDLQVQRDQAERNRIGETLDIEIKRWSAGKEGNLRALLSTMQYVLWPECGWQAVSLTDLITGASVKKVYRKATLCIHPDKVQQKGANLQQKYIAEKVFDLLKEAWNKFNSEELF
ncbi:hypothetical protein ACHQM5_016481 [Ranunculus cassubicifolius]